MCLLNFMVTVTNRRVNALENVTIPRIEGVLGYISRELDELEREGRKFLLLDRILDDLRLSHK